MAEAAEALPPISCRRTRWRRPVGVALLVIIAAASVAVLYLAVSSVLAGQRRDRSADNLRRVGSAIHAYGGAHGRLPGYVRAGNGTPLLSWRVALLPYLGERELYDRFRLDEPWDGPHNRPLLGRMPSVYHLPGKWMAPGVTFYRSFSGPGTLFDPADKVAPSLTSIIDEPRGTIAVVEAREAVSWTRPDAEIPDDPGDRTGEGLRGRIGGHFPGGANVLSLAGEVSFLKETVSGERLKAAITKNGGNLVSEDGVEVGTKVGTDFEANKSLFAAIRAADQLLLYEGLPHQSEEQASFEAEYRNKPTVRLQGFRFYRTPLAVSASDEVTLKAVLGDEGSYREWKGPRLCGAFHPDYLAEWQVGGRSYQFLICFGCGEVKVYGPGSSLRCYLAESGKLYGVLDKYRKNRPKWQDG
jgi:hypothetical protein